MRPYTNYSIQLKLTISALIPLFAAMLIFWVLGYSITHFGLPEAAYHEFRTRINLIFSAILIFAAVIGTMISAWVGHNLSRPIKELEKAAREIASGSYLPDIVLGTHDELAVLAEEFNIMKHKLAERERENHQLNANLEEIVKERTAELEEKNHWLAVAQEELVRAEKLVGIGMLASGVAHEINNPLAIIRGNAELLDMSPSLDESAKGEIETIMAQVGRVERIVANLLTFARTQKIEKHSFKPAPLLDEIIENLSHQINLSRYRIEKPYQQSNLSITGDPERIRQVFTNLIVNALQAMPSGGILTIDMQSIKDTSKCLISISDTGVGIPNENRHKLFSPFFTTKPNGTGLGLAVTYGIVKDHGGDIDVSSGAGKGAIFNVTLPLGE